VSGEKFPSFVYECTGEFGRGSKPGEQSNWFLSPDFGSMVKEQIAEIISCHSFSLAVHWWPSGPYNL